MEYLKFKKKIKNLNRIEDITKILVERIHKIPRFNEELRNDLEFVLYVCGVIENEFIQTKPKTIDKKKIVIDILDHIFKLKPDEIALIEKTIEFLHSNGQIKRLTRYERLCAWMLS